MISSMQALRFLALSTVGFVLLAGTLLWYQQIARLESEAVRVLEGPELALEAGASTKWELDLDGATADQAWMDAQRQPRLTVPLPSGAEGVEVRVTARYVATQEFAESPAFLPRAEGEAQGALARTSELTDGRLDLGFLWLSYRQPLELDLEVLDAGTAQGAVVRPRLAGTVHPDYAFARDIDRTLFNVFFVLGLVGVIGLVLVERAVERQRADP